MLTGHENLSRLRSSTLSLKGRKQHHKRTCGMLSEGSRTSMTYAGGTRNRRKLDKKGDLIKGLQMQKPIQSAITSGYSRKYFHQKEPKNHFKKWRGPFQITELHQRGRFYRLSTGRAAHYENIKLHNASSEDWCIPADMQGGKLIDCGSCL